jgi:hypothetical protein
VEPSVAATWVKRKEGAAERSEVTFMPEEPIKILAYLEEIQPAEASPGIYKMTMQGMQWWLGKQCEQFNASIPKAFIKNTAGTPARSKRVAESKHRIQKENMTDMQGDEDQTITRKELVEIAAFCMSFRPSPGYFEPTPLLFVQTHLALFFSHSLAARGEDIRGMTLGCLKMVLYPTVGPRGMLCLTGASRSGKTNRLNRLVRHSCFADICPLLCSLNALGFSMFYRWNVEHEPHPDWGDGPEAYATLFTTPLLRSPQDPRKPMPYETHRDLIARLLETFSVFTNKVTHFARGNAARLQDWNGVNISEIARFLHKEYNKDMNSSYASRMPPGVLCSAAGYDKDNIRAAGAPHLDAVSGIAGQDLDVCVDLAAPWIREEERKVAASRESVYETIAVGSNKARKESLHQKLLDKRLLMREASINAVREIFRVVLRCAAARARDGDNRIVAHDQPMYLRFHTHPVYQAFSCTNGPTPVFASDAWIRFSAAVAAAENMELEHVRPLDTPMGSATLVRTVRDALAPEFDGVRSQMASQTAMIQGLLSGMKEFTARKDSGLSDSLEFRAPPPPVPPAENLSKCAARKGASRQHFVEPAKGHEQMKEFGHIPDAKAMVEEYKRTAALEKNIKKKDTHGFKWRSYRGGDNAWYERGPIFRRITRFIEDQGEMAALQDLDDLIKTKGSRGASSAPDWAGIVSDLRAMPPEVELVAEKARKARENKEKRELKKRRIE